MREILIRGKQPLINEWCYGTAIFSDGVNTWISFNEPNKPIAYGLKHNIVYKETVGQFTGLTDKNGKRIFEGDILDCKSGLYERCKVIFNEFCSAFQLMCADGFSDFFLCSINHKEMEIIGNIHDNPELLEV